MIIIWVKIKILQVKIFCYFVEKLYFVLKIFKFLHFKQSRDLPNLWHLDKYYTRDRVHFWIYLLNHNQLCQGSSV